MFEILVAAVLAVVTSAQDAPATQDPARDALREELAEELEGPAGFQLVETGPLFVLTQVHDKRFTDGLTRRIELLQDVLDRDFPLELDEGEDPPAPVVVRLFRDKETYVGTGGPAGSSNYVDAEGKRFLIYDPSISARRAFWPALAGLQFKAHWVRAIGMPWPHGWMLHGHEDYYGGFELHAGRLVRRENSLRKDTARKLARQGDFVPFHEFLRWLGPGYQGVDTGQSTLEVYAQGWSVVWFLRTLPESRNKPEGWQPSWELILERYLAGMRTTHKKDVAVDAALTGIDLAALQAAWHASMD